MTVDPQIEECKELQIGLKSGFMFPVTFSGMTCNEGAKPPLISPYSSNKPAVSHLQRKCRAAYLPSAVPGT